MVRAVIPKNYESWLKKVQPKEFIGKAGEFLKKVNKFDLLAAGIPVICSVPAGLGAYGANSIVNNRFNQKNDPNSLWTKLLNFCAEIYPEAVIGTMFACTAQAISFASLPRLVYFVLGSIALAVRKPLKEAIVLARKRDQLELFCKQLENNPTPENLALLEKAKIELKFINEKLGKTNAVRNMFAGALAWFMGGTFFAQVPLASQNIRVNSPNQRKIFVSEKLDLNKCWQMLKQGNIQGVSKEYFERSLKNLEAEIQSNIEAGKSILRPMRGTIFGKNPEVETQLESKQSEEINSKPWSPFKKFTFRVGHSGAFPIAAFLNGTLRTIGLAGLISTIFGGLGISYFNKGSEFYTQQDNYQAQQHPLASAITNISLGIASGTSGLSATSNGFGAISPFIANQWGPGAVAANGISAVFFGADFLGKLVGLPNDALTMLRFIASTSASAGTGLWLLKASWDKTAKNTIVPFQRGLSSIRH